MRNGRSQQMKGMTARFVLRALVLSTLLGLTAGPAMAGSEGRKGTAGAQELRIPIGPRGSALGGAVASDVSGVEAMFWNPAGVAGVTGTDVLLTHTSYFADMKVNFAGAATRLGGFGVLGFGAKILSVGDVIVTTEAAPEGTGEILTPTFSVMGLTWAKQFTDRVNFGATMNYVSESITNNNASGLAFDFGVQYVTDWRGFKLGLVMKNFGTSMSYSGPGFEIPIQDPAADPNANPRTVNFGSTKFEMPSQFTLATSANLVQSSTAKLIALAAFQNNNFSGDNIRGGLEWSYRDLLALRGSYFGTFNGTIDQTTGSESFKFDAGDDLYQGWSVGVGLGTRIGDASRLGLDFAWKPVKNGVFNDIYEMGVRLRF